MKDEIQLVGELLLTFIMFALLYIDMMVLFSLIDV
jgi:hypothetical protein